MNKTILSTTLCCLLAGTTAAFEISTPDDAVHGPRVAVSDPDARVPTLGEVEIFIDLTAAHDDLLALTVRRKGPKTLPDGRAFTAFGVHKDSGLVVMAAGDVTHVSITHVATKASGEELSVLFHGQGGKIIAPRPGDIAAYDRDLKPLSIRYTPLSPPGEISVPVSIMLDASGSMKGHMDGVVASTQGFLRALPDFARCSVTAFNNRLQPITPDGLALPCKGAIRSLDTPIEPTGMTALFAAIEKGLDQGKALGGLNITVVVTDGINTVPYAGTRDSLKVKKASGSSKLFVFWAGHHEPGYLSGLADLEIVAGQDLRKALERFFRALGISISGMQSLHIDRSADRTATK